MTGAEVSSIPVLTWSYLSLKRPKRNACPLFLVLLDLVLPCLAPLSSKAMIGFLDYPFQQMNADPIIE